MAPKVDDITQPTARLVLRLFRAFELDLVRSLEAQGISGVTMAGLSVLRHVEEGGIGLSRLAADAGLTKQAVGKLVQDQENKGYLRVVPDATDGRAKTVMFTPKGQRMIEASVAIIKRFEDRYREALGERRYRDLRHSLVSLTAMHEDGTDAGGAKRRGDGKRRG